jgi:hypothetical protein
MKTTIDIADPILHEARRLAQREGTTLRALVEDGLRRVVSHRSKNKPYRFRLVTSGGGGLTPEAQQMSWSEIRDLSYRRGEE